MGLPKKFLWHKWPLAASLLSFLFIAYGVSLVSRTRNLQSQIGREVELLDELNKINDEITKLGLVHRVEVNSRQYQWSDGLGQLREHIAQVGEEHNTTPAIQEMMPALEQILYRADSLHREAMIGLVRKTDPRNIDAIMNIMLQRGQKVVDRTARSVHEHDLVVHSEILSHRWNQAEVLLVMACLMSVVFAWLVATSNRLLGRSREHAAQLAIAKADLEKTNKDLRETMLSKEEKEIMIKEIHHRVKNNLQIVKSLIRFQMDQVKDPKVIELFNECVNRVSAMALVHEQTYLSKDLANIDVNNYLGQLTRDLCQAYTIDTKLSLDIKINVPTLGVDTLIPLGLLINEIISNSLKYAFKGRNAGTIFVHLDGDQDNLQLLIGDDGVGFPDKSRWRSPQSLGMELIHTLSGQLDSSIELLEGSGTVYRMSGAPLQRQRRA
jgi:two-component sensor histidine kinase